MESYQVWQGYWVLTEWMKQTQSLGFHVELKSKLIWNSQGAQTHRIYWEGTDRTTRATQWQWTLCWDNTVCLVWHINHLVRVRKISCFGLKYLLCLPKNTGILVHTWTGTDIVKSSACGYTHTNVDMQSWTVVSGLSALLPNLPPPTLYGMDHFHCHTHRVLHSKISVSQ